MFPVYEEKKENLHFRSKTSRHASPHLHNSIEFIYITEGTLELGMGQELYHMEEGDIGFVFPNIIHHYQVFTDRENVAVFIKSPPFVLSTFDEVLLNYAPEYPIIKAADVDRETYRALGAVLKTKQTEFAIVQAYLQIVLARCIRNFELVEKRSIGSNDLIYQTVAYVSGNFKNPFSLEDMAKDLGVSKYVLSRIFQRRFIVILSGI